MSNMVVEESEYRNSPVLALKKDELDKYPFSFGLAKAKMIVEAYEEIKAFVKKHDIKPE